MCGIAGLLASSHRVIPLQPRVKSMADSLRHRGPDWGDEWVDTSAGIAFAHRRLSIVDLTASGNQPMQSQNSRFVLVYNGEIYNHLNLREKLSNEGVHVSWRGHSDTETLVECLSLWGVEKTLQSAVGMFAFGLWDKQERSLVLARDRMGEKPLYCGFNSGIFAFGSELKSLTSVPEFTLTINDSAVGKFLQIGYIPDPDTIYTGIYKVPAGTWIEIRDEDVTSCSLPKPKPYWSLQEVAESGQRDPLEEKDSAAVVDQLETLLTSAVSAQLMGDVPVGAFLSGGIDSSTVAAVMQKLSTQAIKTFSIGFEDQNYDEMPYAAAIAQHLGTDHHELRVSTADVTNTVPQLSTVYDEPFADSSQIPTLLVSQLAKRHVSVSLSGDAGDELFAGYNRYTLAGRNWGRIEKVPLAAREFLSGAATRFSPSQWNAALLPAMRLLPQRFRVSLPGEKIHKIAGVLGSRDSQELYSGMITQLDRRVIKSSVEDARVMTMEAWPIKSDLIHQMMFVDATTYLPGDILAKVDRATMAHSLESRMPFLDHRVVEFAWKLPLSMKIRHGQSKWVLRELLRRYVPDSFFERPKMGFGGPLGDWLRGPLNSWADDLLSPERIKNSGYLHEDLVAKMWKEHQSQTHNWEHGLWNIVMLESWLDSERGRASLCEGA